MTVDQSEWTRARDELVRTIIDLGFPGEFGNEIVRNLGSPKAMHRMNGYLINVKPKSVELVVDEMLAIRSEVLAWKEKNPARKPMPDTMSC